MGSDRISPPLRQIFLCQCLDNGISLLIGLAILGSGLSVFNGDFVSVVSGAGTGFWLGSAGLLVFSGIFYRCFFWMLWHTTPGCKLTGLHAHFGPLSLIFESLQPVAPSLWFIEAVLRSLDFPVGVRYSYSYEEATQLG